jgi:hypothetical protein
LAETFREGIPSLPGIQSWKNRTRILKGAGSEFLNAEFGWLPLIDEVHNVGNAARHHREIMNNYHHGEGRDTHRSFRFPLQSSSKSAVIGGELPIQSGLAPNWLTATSPTPERSVSLVRETRKWFEGCFTYALPSSTDSWRKAIGFGSDADKLFGISLTPDLLWELTPWSWAVDWFSNAGSVINNVTNFGLAGLVLRYGYMMEESIESVTAECGPVTTVDTDITKPFFNGGEVLNKSDPCSSSISLVTKRRVPADPFGFSIGWEGLSPTQLAITAALGITRLL